LPIWNLLAAARETHVRAIAGMDEILEVFPIALMFSAFATKRAHTRHMETAADLHMVAARELLVLGIPQPPRNVDVHAAHAVRVVAGQFLERGDVRAQRVTDAIRQIPSDVAGAVSKAVGM